MPDWSYKPLFQPALFALPPLLARDLTLNSLGVLMRLPFGGTLIDFLGHMRPDPRLRQEYAGMSFSTSVGLGVGIDSNAVALTALTRMGLGFCEVGPVVFKTQPDDDSIQLCKAKEAIHYRPGFPTISQERLRLQLSSLAHRDRPLFIRLGFKEGQDSIQLTEQYSTLIAAFADDASAFTLTTTQFFLNGAWQRDEWQQHLAALLQVCRLQAKSPVLLLWLPANTPPEQAIRLIEASEEITSSDNNALIDNVAGIVIGGVTATPLQDSDTPHLWIGRESYAATHALVSALRHKLAAQRLIIASGGVHEPIQALKLLDAGANLIQIDSGLVYSGPGLPKRINEALLYQTQKRLVQRDRSGASERYLIRSLTSSLTSEEQVCQPAEHSWFWTLLLGMSMILGGCIAIGIAATRVLLPYDESFLGMRREEVAALNTRLLPFMTHDRITLAGTMLALGIFYSALSWFAIRRGQHWAKVALTVSAVVGFASFFLFLGFGYFDPFHAFVTAILFQFLLMGLHARLPAYTAIAQPSWHNDWRWQRSLWGQLCFVIQSTAIIGAGVVIALIGITQVLVADDLEYLQTTVDAIQSANAWILPVVAHDRATLGGMLISSGLALLMSALWGYRPGERWLWWAFVLGCIAAYSCAISVHMEVGYLDWVHLAPAFAGVAFTILGAWLSYPYLCDEPTDDE